MARLVFIGLSITSSWGNGHATTYRGLIRALARRGHEVTFLERDVPWYAANRDLPNPPYCRTLLYRDVRDLERQAARLVRQADGIVVGSYVPEGVAVGRWALERATAPVLFYDIDTPVTLAKLEAGDEEYLDRRLVRDCDAYLSFTGGPILQCIEALGSPRATALYCAVDPEVHAPVAVPRRWRLGYLGTYSPDREPAVERLLLQPAAALPSERFAVAGPQYPAEIRWPDNVQRIEHLAPADHAAFYCAQDFTLNVTRADMRAWGYSPSVRLFEAAACGVPIVSDFWPGLDAIFAIGREILLAETSGDMVGILTRRDPTIRDAIAAAARAAVLARHTCGHRAVELEQAFDEAARRKPSRRSARPAAARRIVGHAEAV
ncbi:MAG TPA: glycosyltransferase [Stellaceae bacterium]|nr:glycosyltransferase [Stellaceae bacterium]